VPRPPLAVKGAVSLKSISPIRRDIPATVADFRDDAVARRRGAARVETLSLSADFSPRTQLEQHKSWASGHLYCAASTIDRMTHLLRPATFDVIAGVRVARIGRHTGFGRVMLLTAADQRSAGTMAGNYSMP
jgi:hypothetical protein